MTIKEIENRTGLSRSQIRFYEKEKLLTPARSGQNGYREYTEADVQRFQKISLLRKLSVSVEDIRRIVNGEAKLGEILSAQEERLSDQEKALTEAKALCVRMRREQVHDFEEWEAERYLRDLPHVPEAEEGVFAEGISFRESVKRLWGPAILLLVIGGRICLAVCEGLFSVTFRSLPLSTKLVGFLALALILLGWWFWADWRESKKEARSFLRSAVGMAAMALVLAVGIGLPAVIGLVFGNSPEYVTERNGIRMIARISGFSDTDVTYYEYKNPFFYGPEMIGYEHYDVEGYDPFKNPSVREIQPDIWYFYDPEGNLIEAGGERLKSQMADVRGQEETE